MVLSAFQVAQLESQNQILKQFAPAEVISQLAILVQQHQQKKQQQTSSQVRTQWVCQRKFSTVNRSDFFLYPSWITMMLLLSGSDDDGKNYIKCSFVYFFKKVNCFCFLKNALEHT